MYFTEDKITYIGDDDLAIVQKYHGDDSMVIVPEVVNRRTVIGIYDEAFKDCTTIGRITLPDTIEKIGKHAFANCKKLMEVCFYRASPAKSSFKFKNVFTVGEEAFINCVLLEEFDTGNKLLKVGKNAFCGCENLKYVSQLVQVDAFGFKKCNDLEDLCFSNGFDFKNVNLFWTSSQKRYFLGKDAILDAYAIDFFKRKNIQIVCSEKSILTELAYEGVNVCVEKM